MTNLTLTCSCGQVKMEIQNLTIDRANRVICGCRGCQSFTHFLGREKEILDDHGGTKIFQTSPKNFVFTKGSDQLACVRQTPSGALRWYTKCCKTPLANTLVTRAVPFVGIFFASIDQKQDQALIEKTIGPGEMRVNCKDPAANGSHLKLVSMLFRLSWLLIKWKIAGDDKKSPFFDKETGKPVVKPQQLSTQEYDQLLSG